MRAMKKSRTAHRMVNTTTTGTLPHTTLPTPSVFPNLTFRKAAPTPPVSMKTDGIAARSIAQAREVSGVDRVYLDPKS